MRRKMSRLHFQFRKFPESSAFMHKLYAIDFMTIQLYLCIIIRSSIRHFPRPVKIAKSKTDIYTILYIYFLNIIHDTSFGAQLPSPTSKCVSKETWIRFSDTYSSMYREIQSKPKMRKKNFGNRAQIIRKNALLLFKNFCK